MSCPVIKLPMVNWSSQTPLDEKGQGFSNGKHFSFNQPDFSGLYFDNHGDIHGQCFSVGFDGNVLHRADLNAAEKYGCADAQSFDRSVKKEHEFLFVLYEFSAAENQKAGYDQNHCSHHKSTDKRFARFSVHLSGVPLIQVIGSVQSNIIKKSNTHDVCNYRDDRGCHNNAHNAGDHGRCGRIPHGGCTAAALHTPKASRKGDQNTEYSTLNQADPEVRQRNSGLGLVVIFDHIQIQHTHRNDQSAQYSHQVRVEAQQGHHEGQPQHSRQHQEFHGRDAHGFKGINFFIHLHGAQLGRESGSRAARHDDSGHDGPHDTHHGNAHQIGHIYLRTEHH